MNNKIAITFFNLIQYYTLQPALDEMLKRGYNIDIYIPDFVPEGVPNDSGYLKIYNDTYDYLSKLGYKIKRKYNGEHYKMVLSPYNVKNFFDFKYTYNIRYNYAVNTKPIVGCKLPDNIDYDFMFVFSSWDEENYSNFCQTYLVGNTKFFKFKKEKNKNDKPVILYLPTYGKLTNLENIQEFKKLKKDYKLIIKLHHQTSYLDSEKNKRNGLTEVFDEIYEQDCKLVDLLKKCDLVISDYSGAIFDTINAEIPVCIYADTNCNVSVGNFEPLQNTLIKEKVILATDDPKRIGEIVKKSLSKDIIKKQVEVRNKLFPDNDELVDIFIEKVDIILNEKFSLDKYNLHKYLQQEIKTYMKNDYEFYKQLVEVSDRNKELEDMLNNKSKNTILKRIINKIKRIIKHK